MPAAAVQITALGYRQPDFIAVHWYGQDFTTATAVGELTMYLTSMYSLYGKPLWLTEFALTIYGPANANVAPIYPSYEQQVAFVNAMVPVLEGLSFVERYAWFGLPQDGLTSDDTTGLYYDNGSPTPTGSAYRVF